MNKEPYLTRMGNAIKILRKERGLTQNDLASKCGYKSNTTINKIELGINDISYSKLFNMANALNISPLKLIQSSFSEKDFNAFLEEVLKEKYGNDVVKLLELYTSLNDKDKKNAFILINGLVNEKNSQMSSKI